MPRDDAYLRDMLDAARLTGEYLQGKQRSDFLADTLLQDAVIRRLALLGEAARRVSVQTREKHPDLPWREMVDMRNLVIHEYDDIDFDIVWRTATADLPALIARLKSIVES